MTTEDNGRNHEPNLRELTAELDGLRCLVFAELRALNKIIDERDRLYKERDDARRTAVDAALAAAKEQTASSFSASEKAIVKAENAQSDYNLRSNEFRGQLDDQAKRLIARIEVEAMVRNVEEKLSRMDGEIRTLRESHGEHVGQSSGKREIAGDTRANIAIVISVIGGIAGLIGLAIIVIRAFSGH